MHNFSGALIQSEFLFEAGLDVFSTPLSGLHRLRFTPDFLAIV